MSDSLHAVEDVFVRTITYQAKEVLSFELRRVDGCDLPPFTAGSHIEVILPTGMVRSYSLVNSQHERHRYVIAVGRDPASRGGSRFLHDNVRAGDRLRIGTPRNNFSLNESAEFSLFIAGGIGVTPVLSMIRRLEVLGRKWVLHYATRERKRTAFLQEVIDLSCSEAGNLHLHFDDEQPGHFLDLGAIVSRASAGTHLYCCGPTPMLQAFEAATSDWSREQIHVEYFSPKSPPATTGGFEVVLSRSERTLYVSEGTTILDALLAENVDVAYSCREGTCGTCETRVLEGVPDHRDVVLSDAERRSNSTMMICCSGARSARLILDL